MTNKVKPFFIRITDDMTPQMVQDAFDKCVDTGAVACEGVKFTDKKHKYSGCHSVHFGYFGINGAMETFLGDKPNHFHKHAQEITLDQLDEWLGLEAEQEWRNGDECVINRKTSSGETLSDTGVYYAETETHYWLHGIGCRDKKEATGNIYSKKKYWLSKPETPEQKAEREQKKEMLEFVDAWCEGYNKSIDCSVAMRAVCDALFAAGYRKQ